MTPESEQVWDRRLDDLGRALWRLVPAAWRWRILVGPALALVLAADAWQRAELGLVPGSVLLGAVVALALLARRRLTPRLRRLWAREAAFRARARLRAAWPTAAAAAGLEHDGEVARLARVVTVDRGIRAELRLPAGQAVSQVIDRADRLASALAAAHVQIRPGSSASGADLLVVTDALPAELAVDDLTRYVHPTRIWLGEALRGPCYWDLATTAHVLVSAPTRMGKSATLTLVAELAQRAGHRVRVVTAKPVGFAAAQAGVVVAHGLEASVGALEAAVAEMWARYDALPAGEEEWSLDRDGPYTLVLVDEGPELILPDPSAGRTGPGAQDNTLRARAGTALSELLRLGGAAGIRVMVAAQRVDVGGAWSGLARMNATGRIALGPHDAAGSQMMLGSAAATGVPPIPGRALVARTQAGEAGDLDIVQLALWVPPVAGPWSEASSSRRSARG